MAACRAREAQAAADDVQAEEEALQRAARVAEALACPCVDELKRSPCGPAFTAAFTCFHLSTSAPRGCDCLAANLAFAACLRANPDSVGADGGAGAAAAAGAAAGAAAAAGGPRP